MGSWLDAFVGTVENVPVVDGSVATVVKLSVFVNAEAVGKQGRKVRI